MFGLVTARPVAVLMLAAAAALFGVLSYQQLGVELMPDLAYPTITLRTVYPGAAPEEVESEVTRTVEERVGTVEGLLGLRSSSRAGRSEVVLEFAWDTDMDRASQRVRERLGHVRLPDVVEKPQLLRHDPSLAPVLTLALGSEPGGPSLARLRTWAEDTLAPEISKIDGVAAVRVAGGVEREVQVRLSEAALAARGLSVATVADRLRQANVNLAGGTLREGTVEFLVRTRAELRTVADLRQVVVDSRDGVVVRLVDVAEVTVTGKERVALVRVDGREAVRVDVLRRADANIVEVCDRVRTAIFGDAAQQAWVAAHGEDDGPAEAEGEGKKRRRAQLAQVAERKQMTDFVAFRRPAGSRLDVLGDQSLFIRAALDEVRGAALWGGLLAILVLYVFLRSGWSTLVVAVAIPLSLAVTFAPLMFLGVTLNIMSLGGLALGVGMLVDNAVVVLESIHRCREEGDDARAAAIRGAQEVGAAVTASTFTTVAVFFPITFVGGVAGQVFGDLALAVVCSLLASLAVALFVVPTLAARGPGLGKSTPRLERPDTWRVRFRALPAWWAWRRRRAGLLVMPLLLPYSLLQATLELLGNVLVIAFGALGGLAVAAGKALAKGARLALWPLAAGIGAAVEALRGVYGPALVACLRTPLAVALVLGGLGWAAWSVADRGGAELLPDVRQGVLTAELSFPVGTPLVDTAARVAGLERALAEDPAIDRVEALIGAPEDADDEGGDRGPHTATLTLRLAPTAELVEAEEAVSRHTRAAAAQVPGAELELGRPALFSLRPPIRVVLLGHHLGLLADAAGAIVERLEAVPGLTDVTSSVRRGYPELQVAYDRVRLAALGMQPRDVAERTRGQLEGVVATELRRTDVRMDVRVRLDPDRVASREALGSTVINAGEETPLPLEAVATLSPGEGPADIRRVDGQRAAEITGRAETFDLGRTAEAVRATLATLPLPAGFELRTLGQDAEMQASLRDLRWALLLAIFLVYVVLASQFESLRAPLVILGSLPLAGVGVFIVLGLMAVPISVVVFVGLITLAGIVVNNAIVLVDYANQLQRRGLGLREALVEAGRVRLRPILMTTLTTVLALLPMVMEGGEGAELRRPLALTLVAGLVFATGLTLVVIPVLYRWVVGTSVASGPGSAER